MARQAVERGELTGSELVRFPHLLVAPAILGLLWSGLFEQYRHLDVEEMLRAYFGVLFDRMAGMNETDRDRLDGGKFAFPKERKEPIHDAAHVRNAIARFNQVQGVSDTEKDAAWKRIQAAARKYGVELEEKDWREL